MDKFTKEQISKGMFNEDQVDYMIYLTTLKPEEKCQCGWYKLGKCFGSCYGDETKGGHPKVIEQRER